MGVLCLIYMICALRTNIVFVLIFAGLVPGFGCLAGAYWHLAQGNSGTAGTLIIAAGAVTFFVDICGWWIFFAILLASLDFPFQLPGMLKQYNLLLALSLANTASHSRRSLFRYQGREPEEEGTREGRSRARVWCRRLRLDTISCTLDWEDTWMLRPLCRDSIALRDRRHRKIDSQLCVKNIYNNDFSLQLLPLRISYSMSTIVVASFPLFI